ncbi:MAG: hypothetical protein NVSMB25_21900 [Thermoleophilaceae bacterium]
MSVSFAASYVCLCAAQGAAVALPRPQGAARLPLPRSSAWALAPLASIVAVVFGIRAAAGLADGLTYLALITTPPLALLALTLTSRVRGKLVAVAVIPLFALAWVGRGTLAGEAASVILTALGCITLAVLLAAVAPSFWLKLGILTMSLADTALVVVQLLQSPNERLNAAAPALGLPQFQRAHFGDAVMGYGDLFLAALLGALLAVESRPLRPPALACTVLAVLFGLLFFWVKVLPATVPVAATLVIVEVAARRRQGSERDVARLHRSP